jgi:hypothetical protein
VGVVAQAGDGGALHEDAPLTLFLITIILAG